ncbi:hypothetical protein GE09DRAFT_244224 [Coniochaeta sp. 2T2.1]|nr:hypothetical protein GE09DRAFT_244224 [Coniochaeta sp. 2T2.1]
MQAKVLSILLAATATAAATAVALPQCEYLGYLNTNNCPAGSRAFLSATNTVGFCVQVESGYPVTSIKVTQLSPCPAGQKLVLDVSAELCDNFKTIATFEADGSCTEIAEAQGASVQALQPRCV